LGGLLAFLAAIWDNDTTMAKKGKRNAVIMNSTESGHSYHTQKNKENNSERLELKKYDPLLRKHVVYKEKK
jgi:large subunit ribosomal protein L33